jgi:hypothetical protein
VAILGPDLLHLAGGLLKTPHLTTKTDKWRVVNLYLCSTAEKWLNHNLSFFAQQQHFLVTHRKIFPPSDLPCTFPPAPPISTASLCMAVGSSSLHRLSSPNKACADVGLPPTYPSMLLFNLTEGKTSSPNGEAARTKESIICMIQLLRNLRTNHGWVPLRSQNYKLSAGQMDPLTGHEFTDPGAWIRAPCLSIRKPSFWNSSSRNKTNKQKRSTKAFWH